MTFSPKIPSGGKATAIFGLILISIFWFGTTQRGAAELAEARASELSKNANLALALDVQTNQLLAGFDQFLLLMKDQYEGASPGIPLRRLMAPSFAASQSVTFVGVTDAQGNVVESLRDFVPTNVFDREFFQAHLREDTRRLLISSPVLGRVSGRWAITLTRRVNRPDGGFAGIVAISIEPSYLTQLFETTMLGPSDVVSLVLTNGVTLARRQGDAFTFGADIAQTQLIAEQRAQPVGSYVGPSGGDGLTRMFAYRTMRSYPVIATVGTLERDALAAVSGRRRIYFGWALLMSAIIVSIGAITWQLLARNDRATRRLREQASLLDKAQDAIVVTDLDRRLTFWNKGAERLYGWTADEVLGKVITEVFFPGGETNESRQAYDHVLRQGEWTGELQPRTKSGRRVVIESRWTLVRDDEGRALGTLSINTDVTDRRQLEQQFYRAQRLESIGTMAGGIAHDLNNVLAPIMMGIGLLRERFPDADSREVLDTMNTSAQRGAEMVSQVLSFAKGQEVKRVEISAADLVGDVVRIARDTLPKSIELTTDVDPDLPLILGDATQCHQVLLNLLVNARDAMPHGGQLRLTATRTTIAPHQGVRTSELAAGDYVVLRVDDTGTGMPAHLLETIFDPFFTTKDAGKGTGLGLSTSQTIVRNHGGHIRVFSEPGRGTSFHVYLPVAPASSPAAVIGEKVSAPHGQGQTVLVVDDEESVRKVLKSTLEKSGYKVLQAANGREALTIYQETGPSIDAVVIDMTMPVLGGVPTMQELVKMNPSVRIIAASGIHDNEATAKSIGRQVTHFLAKPFTSDMLLRAVARAVAG